MVNSFRDKNNIKSLLIFHNKALFFKEDSEELTNKVKAMLRYCFDTIEDTNEEGLYSDNALIVDNIVDMMLGDKFQKVVSTGYVEINFYFWKKIADKRKFQKMKDIFTKDLNDVAKKVVTVDSDFTL